LVPEGQGSQEYGVSGAENGSIRANAQRQRDYSDEREARMPQQVPDSVANVFEHCFHEFTRIAAPPTDRL
jgi:hypothetical protein